MSFQFKDQIIEDISLIQKSWGHLDNNIRKREYAFNYWILSRIFDLDEQIISDYITEYNDKSIDCYVHYQDSKELFIIQNKYFDENTRLERSMLTDFLTTPLVCLNDRKYKKSQDLQVLFNEIKEDPEYKIYLHFYISNNGKSLDADAAIKNFNNHAPIQIKPLLRAGIFYLDDIKNLYYGNSYTDVPSFKFVLSTKVRGNILKILPQEYDLPTMSQAYYMLTPVEQLYEMYKNAKEKKYPLFEENIREYLGKKSSINKGIINTIKDKKDRSNFFYYNNGITIICEKTEQPKTNQLTVTNPQIVNGCQTVNSIYEVLSDYTDQEIKDEFAEVFVMVKVLLFDKKTKEAKPRFYLDIVKYTNKQNAINENAFGAKEKVFNTIQKEFKERGFLLQVKPSDRNSFLNQYSGDAQTNDLLKKANELGKKIDIQFKSLNEILIPLEKLLQVYVAFIKTGFFAFTKKDSVLKPSSDIYKEFSIKIGDELSIDNMLKLYLIYLKAEDFRSESEDKKTPIPYYLIGFLGYFIKNEKKRNDTIKSLFDSNSDVFPVLFEYLSHLTTLYRDNFIDINKTEYNIMIKRPIDTDILKKQIATMNTVFPKPILKKFFESLY